MALKPGQFATDIEAEDIRELCRSREPESAFIEFKQTLFVRIPEDNRKVIDDQIEDTLADIVAFANAGGGHIIVGIEELSRRAERIFPLTKDESIRIAQIIRDRAAAFIRPPLFIQLTTFMMDIGELDWVLVVTIPPGGARPFMSSFREQTKFVIRDGDRKRPMNPEEIREAFLQSPLSREIAGIYLEITSLRALIEQLIKPKITNEES